MQKEVHEFISAWQKLLTTAVLFFFHTVMNNKGKWKLWEILYFWRSCRYNFLLTPFDYSLHRQQWPEHPTNNNRNSPTPLKNNWPLPPFHFHPDRKSFWDKCFRKLDPLAVPSASSPNPRHCEQRKGKWTELTRQNNSSLGRQFNGQKVTIHWRTSDS